MIQLALQNLPSKFKSNFGGKLKSRLFSISYTAQLT